MMLTVLISQEHKETIHPIKPDTLEVRMKTYKHWLKISWRSTWQSSVSQWKQLKEYLDKSPDSKITVYNRIDGNMFDKFFCLQCHQNYNDLDLDCNSFSTKLIHLDRKPGGLEPSPKDFLTLFNIYNKDGKRA